MLLDSELNKFNEFYGKYKIDFQYFEPSSEKRYLTNFLCDFIDSWECTVPVFISAQTGMGKNYFVLHYLTRHLVAENKLKKRYKKILLLSNRVALTRQGKKQLAEILLDITGDNNIKRMEYFTEEGIDRLYIDFGIITVCSYQQLYNKLKHKEGRKNLQEQNFQYVIFDECHFFTADSTFNRDTQYILRHSIETFQKSTRIYMSATLEEVFIPIINAESKAYKEEEISCEYYYFKRNYDYIDKITVYNKTKDGKMEELCDYIKKQDSSDKWLVFVASKKDGEKFRDSLKEDDIETVFLTSDSKNKPSSLEKAENKKNDEEKEKEHEYQTYKNIVENEKFSETVLISTSVLDNGINIKDTTVKHVVIDMLDRTELIQMLGRIRFNKDQKINLYIRKYEKEDIEKFLRNDIRALIVRLQSDSVPNKNRTDYYQNFKYLNFDKEKIFRLTEGKKQFKYNKCSIYKLMDRITNFLNILYAVDPNYAIDEKSLGELRDDRARIYQHYLQENSYKNDILLHNQFCQILESVEEKGFREERCSSRDFSEATKYSFLAYVFKVLIPNFFAKATLNYIESQIQYNLGKHSLFYYYAPLVDELNLRQSLHDFKDHIMTYHSSFDDDDKIIANEMIAKIDKTLEKIDDIFNHYSSMLYLNDSEVPALTEQMHWIERDLIYGSDFNYLNENGVNLPTEEEIAELIERHAITCDDFKEFSKKNNQNTSFRKLDTLKDKGSPIKDLNQDYQKIFDYFSNRDGITYKPNDLQKRLEQEPFVLAEISYELKIVRSTKTGDQHKYCIFVRCDKVRCLNEEEKGVARFNDC